MPQTVNASPLRWSKSKDSFLRVTRQAGIKKKGGGWVFFTPQVCAARRSQLWAKMYLWHKNGVKRDCAQTDKCVHNLYGQHCCDSTRICDLQQMCHWFPPTNSLLFSALMVRAHYLFHMARQAPSGDRIVLGVATTALPSTTTQLSIRDVASWQPHHIDSAVM